MPPTERAKLEARIPILRQRLDNYRIWLRTQEAKEQHLRSQLSAHRAYIKKGTAKADALSAELSRIYLRLKDG